MFHILRNCLGTFYLFGNFSSFFPIVGGCLDFSSPLTLYVDHAALEIKAINHSCHPGSGIKGVHQYTWQWLQE